MTAKRIINAKMLTDAGAPPGAGLRPLLRLLRHVRAVGEVHPRTRQRERERRQGQGGPLHLRPGSQLHHLASSPDELGDPGHRGPDDRASSPIPHSMSPTGAANGCATTSGGSTACRRWATPTSPGCSTSSTTWRPGERPASCWPTDPCPRARRRDPQEPDRGRSGGLHCGAAWPAVPLLPRYPPASGSCPGAVATGNTGTGGARFCSSTPASWAT